MGSDQQLPTVYTIHTGVAPGPERGGWLEGSEIVARDDGTALVTATVRDQAMLLGLLIRISDLGIPLLGLYPGSDLRRR